MRNDDERMNNLLRASLKSAAKPDTMLVQRTKNALIREEPVLSNSVAIRRPIKMVIVTIMVLVLFCATALAAWVLLKPSEVAEQLGNSLLAATFESETAVNINASLTSGQYSFTLLGIATGKDITDMPYNNGNVQSDRTYAVLAIQKTDGSPMPDMKSDDDEILDFYTTPFVKGQAPWLVNATTMNGAYSETVVDGILYRIVECDGVSVFADRGLYFAVATGAQYTSDAFSFDDASGTITANKSFNGSSVVFDLPIDTKMADVGLANEYLNNLPLK